MAIAPVVLGYITAGAAAVGAVATVSAGREQRKAAKEQQRAQQFAAEKQKRIDDIRAQRERVKAVRAQRRAVATAQAREESSGVSTSTTAGTIGTIKSQTTSAVGTALQTGRLLEEISIFNQRASASAQRSMDSAGRFSSLADFSKGVGNVASIFG